MIYPAPTYIFKWYIFQKITFPHPVPEGHTETHQLKFIPQVLACYIQYQAIYSTDLYFPNCWYHIWILVYHFNLHIFPKKLQHYTIHIYIVFKFFIPSAFQKYNICWIYVVWSRICVFLYMCICLFAILDTHNYLLWGPVLPRNHCRQTLILYIRAYMPSAECTLLRSRGGGAFSWRYICPGYESYSQRVVSTLVTQ